MQPMEDFIIDLIERSDPGILSRLPNYIQEHMAQHRRNPSFERDRLAQAVADRAPDSRLKWQVVDLIRAQNA